jgi:hypothetical protein
MNKNRFVLLGCLFLPLLLLACGEKPASATTEQGQSPAAAAVTKGPTITLSKTRLAEGEHVLMKGAGFTPLSDAISHLKKPDGSEYNPIIFLTNEKGEIEHDIEPFLLPLGVLEVWVIDAKTGVSSNVAKFETTHDQQPPAK